MNKLYLSSYRVPNPKKLYALIGKEPNETSGAIITNAKDRKSPANREQKISKLETFLSNIGLNNTVRVDLRNDEFQPSDYDFIYAIGGNTFDLRRAMVESGFDETLKQYLEQGGTYVGESAGAIVVGPSLRGFDIMDDAPSNPIWDGAGIIDSIIVPHNDSIEEIYRNRAPEIQELNPNFIVIPLNDDEDYIVDK